jgi:hypothetical protein
MREHRLFVLGFFAFREDVAAIQVAALGLGDSGAPAGEVGWAGAVGWTGTTVGF